MDGLNLLAEAQAAGLRVEAQGERLIVRGPRQAEPLAKRIIEHKNDVMQALTVVIRILAFRRQLADWRSAGRHGWPLFALPDVGCPPSGTRACISCAALILTAEPGHVIARVRCIECVEAIRLAIEGEPTS